MEEMLLVGGGKSPGVTVLDVDPSKQTLGATNLVDVYGHPFTKVGTGNATIQDVSGQGRVMSFSGSTYFETPMAADISMAVGKFEVRSEFYLNNTATMAVWATGDYVSTGNIVGGVLQVPNLSGGSQYFVTDSIGNFVRAFFTPAAPGWNDFSMIWDSTTKVMKIVNNNNPLATQQYIIPYGFGNGTKLSVGGSYPRGVGSYTLQGYLKRLRIIKLP